MHLRLLLTMLSFLFLQSDPPGDPKDPPKDDKDDVKFDDKQQQKINDMLAAERKSAEDRTAQRLKGEAIQQAQKDKEQRERDEAEKRGEFDTVKTNLERKLAEVERDRDAFKTERDAYRELVSKDVDASWESIPKEVRETYVGEDDDALAKKQHIVRNAKIIERISQTREEIDTDAGRRGQGGTQGRTRESPTYQFGTRKV